MPPSPDYASTLRSAHIIAIVGCSARPSRTSHGIAKYLQEAGYRVIPVNPNYDKILGETCYPDLQHVPADVPIDIVDIFRAPQHTAEMVRTAVARSEATGEQPLIWTQLGVSTDEAKKIAQEAGLPYVQNRCIMVEHQRLVG